MLQDASRQAGRPLPDLEFGMGVKLEDHDRYYFDEQRMDKYAEWSIGAGITIPFSLRGMARARRARMEALAHALDIDAHVLQQKYQQEAGELAEDLAVSVAEHQQSISRERALAEVWRVTERQADQLPDLIKGDPQAELLKRQAAWLEACEDVVSASAQVISCQLRAAGLREEFDLPSPMLPTPPQVLKPDRQEGSQY
jgi:hypothetical protein